MAVDASTSGDRASVPATARGVPTVTLLSFVAGSMDAIAFIALGEVFTSAMSGNTVLLGIAAAQGNPGSALRVLAAIGGYVVGVAIASWPVRRGERGYGKFALEALFLVAFAVLWFATGGPVGPGLGYVLLGLSSIAMGIQGAIGRMIGISGLLTVVFTSTYTAIVGSIVERFAGHRRPPLSQHARWQLMALAAYFGGALLSGFVTTHWMWIAPAVPLTAVAALATGLCLRTFDLGPARRA